MAVLYYATDGPNWKDNVALDGICEFAGVVCGPAGHIKTLIFNDQSLRGTIPWELSLLSVLTFLDVSGNFLEGTIPTELGRLTALSELNVNGNALAGTIPSI